ncbi:MAG: ABC transporter substrate-binding protein [Anaerolineales bacterium]|nr:MAG: ABC transporter substrate-binding protein [Anaerolineales bacterium]
MKKLLNLFLIATMLLVAVPVVAAAPPPQDGGQDYVVVADDWLSNLADKFLGDVLAYPAITYYTNQKNSADSSYARISNSDEIEVGWKIYIPSSEEAQAYFAGQTTTVGATGDTVKIGALAPLSAPGSVTGGAAMTAAFEIAVEEINAAGGVLGKPVELVLVDTEGLPERGTAAMVRLINQEQVVGVVGEYHSAVGLTAKEVAHANGVPTVFAETWSADITRVQYPEVFRIAPLSPVVSSVDAEFVASLPGIEKVVIMSENTGYGIPAAADTEAFLAEKGIAAVSFFADLGTQDFSGIVERVKAENPDLIWVLSTGETSYNFQQQAAEGGIGPQDVPMVCNQVAADSDAYWANVPDGNLCFYRRIGLPKQKFTEATTAFEARYVEKTGKESAESYAMEAYDSLKIMAQAINEAGSTDPGAIISALENISYDGALGTITFPYGTQNPVPDDMDAMWWHQFPDPAITIRQYTEVGQADADAATVFPATYKTADPVLP